MIESVRCGADGCNGTLNHVTNGAGRAVSHCAACERRKQWTRANLPPLPVNLCRICAAPTRGARYRRYCDPCKALVKQKERREYYLRKCERKRKQAMRGVA